MPDLTANLQLIKPFGNEQANLFATDGGTGQAELNEDIINTYAIRSDLNDYVPVLSATTTNPNLGTTSEVRGEWEQLQDGLVYGWARLLAGGSGISAGSGNYEISLPVPFDTTFHPTGNPLENKHILGNGFVRDNSNALRCMPVAIIGALVGNTRVRMVTHTFVGKTIAVVTDSQPFTLAADDCFSIRFMYKAAV